MSCCLTSWIRFTRQHLCGSERSGGAGGITSWVSREVLRLAPYQAPVAAMAAMETERIRGRGARRGGERGVVVGGRGMVGGGGEVVGERSEKGMAELEGREEEGRGGIGWCGVRNEEREEMEMGMGMEMGCWEKRAVEPA